MPDDASKRSSNPPDADPREVLEARALAEARLILARVCDGLTASADLEVGAAFGVIAKELRAALGEGRPAVI